MPKRKKQKYEVNDTHYIRDGIKYDRVTSILGIIRNKGFEKLADIKGQVKADEILSNKADFGKTFHHFADKINRSKLTPMMMEGINSGDPKILKRVINYQDWKKVNIKRVLYSEQVYFDDNYRYAGTVDILAKMKDGKTAVIDLKTAERYDPMHFIQLCAYSELCYVKVDKLIILYVKDNSIMEKTFDDPEKIEKGAEVFYNIFSVKRYLENLT